MTMVAPPPEADSTQPAMVPPPTLSQMPPYPSPAGPLAPPPSYASLELTSYGANFTPNYRPPIPNAPPVLGEPSAPVILVPYPDMPWPTYKEATGMEASLKDDDDNDHIRSNVYAPLYPTYRYKWKRW